MGYKIEKANSMYRIFSEYEPAVTIGYESTLEDAEVRIEELEKEKQDGFE